MRNVLVTGADGFIGSHLVEKISRAGDRVFAICLPGSEDISRIIDLENVMIVESDLEELSDKSITDEELDVIYHLAWDSPSGVSRADIENQTKNVSYSVNLMSVAEKYKCKRIVVTGTVSEELCPELETQNGWQPIAYYLFTKRYIRNIMKQWSAKNNVPLSWITFCHPIGKYNKTEQLITSSILKLRNNVPIKLGDGKSAFNVIAVSDLVNALYLAGVKELKTDIYFVGGAETLTVKDYMEKLRSIINPDGILLWGEASSIGLDLKHEWLCDIAFITETGYKPLLTFEQAVIETANWLASEEVNE